MGTPSYSEYVPLYVTSRQLTPAYAYGDGAPSLESAWWTFRNLQRIADRDDEKNQPLVAKALANDRSGVRKHVDEVEDQARSYLRSGREKEAFALLEAMSQSEAEGILTQVKTLTTQIDASTTKPPTNAVLPGTGGCAHCSIMETGQSPKGVFAGALLYGLVFFVRRRRAARKLCPVAI